MYTIEKISTFEELDEILPLIDKLHEQNREYSGLFTKSGYLAWLVTSFPNLAIWVGREDGIVVGYIMVAVQYTYGKREAIVYEAYCESNNEELVDKAWQTVMDWAKGGGCHFLSCYSQRGKAIARKYGFTVVREYLTKEL